MPKSRITYKGQTTIPKLVRERLGVSYGDDINFILKADGTVVVEAAHVPVTSLKGLLARKGQKRVTVEQMDDAVRQAATEGASRRKSR